MTLKSDNILERSYDEIDNWFNELDEQTLELINNNNNEQPTQPTQPDPPDPTSNALSPSSSPDEEPKQIYVIEDIIKSPIHNLSSNELIQHEFSVCFFIQMLMEETSFNKIKKTDSNLTLDKMSDIVDYLSWVSNVSKILARKIGQEIIPYIPNSPPSIVRSSYNFCTRYTQCKNFYSKYEQPTCKEHHYVHSLLKYDIDSIITFLQYLIKNKLNISPDELTNLYLSIKTICFVTKHMAKEIYYIDYITKKDSEKFHRSNPIDLGRKKNNFKKLLAQNIRSTPPSQEKVSKKKIIPVKKNIIVNRFSVLSDS